MKSTIRSISLLLFSELLLGCPGFGDPAPDTAPLHPGYNPDIALELDSHCTVCHTQPPQNGAPRIYDFTQYLDSSPTVLGALTNCCAIGNVTRTVYMPPASQPPLSPADIEVFTRWVADGCPLDENGPPAHPPCP